MEAESPFSIPLEQIHILERNTSFQALRAGLARGRSHSFCTAHRSSSISSKQNFVLHRDILHSLLLPVLHIQSHAASFASQTLSRQWHSRWNKNPPSPGSPPFAIDLEVAFRGEARGAFSWLQCFMAEEQQWCRTEGCAACVVLKILHSEPFIRIVVASCRLGGHLKNIVGRGDQDSHALTFPDFAFWESAVRRAVADDDFWGLHFWEDIEARANDLEAGIKDLIRQGCEISTASPGAQPSPQRRAVISGGVPSVTTPPLTRQESAEQQTRLQQEEQVWMQKIVEACWLAAAQESVYEGRTLGDYTSGQQGLCEIGT